MGVAYRMLGSAWDAEDVVAEAMVRWLRVDRAEVREPAAYLTTVVTRLALDQLRSARATRESYVGEWLPEPVLTEPSPLGPLDTLERREAVSIATLRMMEALTPAERAVLVLHEAFGVPHAEIAATIGVTEETARQHLRRARTRVARDGRRFDPPPDAHDQLFERFLRALEDGDLDGLRDMLAADVVAYSDGGGKAQAARYPVRGAARVARFYRSLRRRHAVAEVRRVVANGRPAALLRFGRQRQLLAVAAGPTGIREIHSIMNPDKLTYIEAQLRGALGA